MLVSWVCISAADGSDFTFEVAFGAHCEVCEAYEAACDGEETQERGTHCCWVGVEFESVWRGVRWCMGYCLV
jgi:hypothetical protein